MKKDIPMASSFCNECFEKGMKFTGNFITCACPHNQVVGIMEIKNGEPSGMWRLFTPATPQDVARILRVK